MTERPAGLRERVRSWGKRGGAVGGSVIVAAALVAGVLFGDGIAHTVVNTTDGVTWLGDDSRGDVVQVNPSTGKPESRVHVGAPGSDLDVAQRDGLLVVVDRKSGVVTLLDLATLLTTGRRQVTPGDATEVLLDGDRTYLLDRDRGTITNIDPMSASTIGQEWRVPAGLADAAVDGARGVWALDRETSLHKLTWSDDVNRFVEQSKRAVDGTGADSVLVAHDRGVTVLGPESGVVVQVETGNDLTLALPGLRPPLHAAETSPADLVPAAVEETGTVVMVRADEVLEIGVAGVSCERPGEPAVLNRLVYVPCLGARKVVVLNENGRQARPDVITPEGGDPELVPDDGRIMVNVPGADTGVVIEPDGSTRTVATYHPDGTEPGAETPPPSSEPPPPAGPEPPPSSGDVGGGGGLPIVDDLPIVGDLVPDLPAPPPAAPSSPPPTTTPPPPPDPPTPEEVVPTAVTAQARPDGSVLVSWTPGPARPTRFNVFFQPAAGGQAPLVAQAEAAARTAVVTTLEPATVGAFYVLGVPPGYEQGQELPSSPLSGEVTTFTRPGAAPNLEVARGFAIVLVRWGAAPANGRPVEKYQVTVQSGDHTETIETTERTATLALPCDDRDCADQRVVLQVVAFNEAGAGEPARLETVLAPRREW